MFQNVSMRVIPVVLCLSRPDLSAFQCGHFWGLRTIFHPKDINETFPQPLLFMIIFQRDWGRDHKTTPCSYFALLNRTTQIDHFLKSRKIRNGIAWSGVGCKISQQEQGHTVCHLLVSLPVQGLVWDGLQGPSPPKPL